jgi:hypothetical protein
MRSRTAWLGGITLAGAALRVWSPGRIGIWRDEAQLLNIAALPGYGDICRFLLAHESHPPLMYFLVHAVRNPAELSILLLVCAIAAIPVSYFLGRAADSALAGLLSAAALALSAPVIINSVQVRPYGMMAIVLAFSTLALVNAVFDDRTGWRAAWAAASIIGLYLHHVGVLLLVAQAGSVMLLALMFPTARSSVRRWLFWLGAVLVLAVPDIHLLVRQAQLASHLAAGGGWLLCPWRLLGFSALGHPAVLLLPVATSVPLLVLPRSSLNDPVRARTWFVAASYILLSLLMTIANYRAGFLAVPIIVMTAPLSLVMPSIVVARLWRAGRRVWWAVAVEVVIVALAIDGVAWWGYVKGNAKEVARFVAAEAAPSDLLIIAPGSLGASINYGIDSRLSQIDFPYAGAVLRFPFDHHFERMANPGALRAVLDSMAAASSEGRRIWLVMQTDWIRRGVQPEVLDSQRFSALGAADASRANFLRQQLHTRFGAPVKALLPHDSWPSTELLQAELFVPRAQPAGQATATP